MKKCLSFFLVVLMILMTVGCSATTPAAESTTPSEPEENAQAQTVESGEEGLSGKITMWTFLDPENGTDVRSVVLKKIISDFNEMHPNVEVVVEPQTWNLLASKFVAANAAGNAPDIIWLTPDDATTAISVGAIEPLENLFLDEWTEEEIADIDNQVFQVGATPDKHYIIGISSNAFMLYYRSDLFEKYGIELNEEGTFDSWDDFLAACQTLTGYDEELGLDRYGLGVPMSPAADDGSLFLTRLVDLSEGNIYNADGTANYNTPAGQEAFQYMLDLIYKYKVVSESDINNNAEDVLQAFLGGRTAMIFINSARMSQVTTGITVCDGEDVKIMGMPKTDGEYTQCQVVGWSAGVWSGSKNKDAAGAFLEYMTGKEADKLWTMEALQNPIHRSTIEDNPDFFNLPENQFFKVINDAINAGYIGHNDAGYNMTSWKQDFNVAVSNATMNGMTISEALEQAENDYNSRNVQ